jgi:hypothetical protein
MRVIDKRLMSRNQGNYVSKVSEKEEVKDKCKVKNEVGEKL